MPLPWIPLPVGRDSMADPTSGPAAPAFGDGTPLAGLPVAGQERHWQGTVTRTWTLPLAAAQWTPPDGPLTCHHPPWGRDYEANHGAKFPFPASGQLPLNSGTCLDTAGRGGEVNLKLE